MKQCKCCNVEYEVGGMNFYNLCESCFNNFDNQKMNGRFGSLSQVDINYTESSDTFVESGKCDHTETYNLMGDFRELLKVFGNK